MRVASIWDERIYRRHVSRRRELSEICRKHFRSVQTILYFLRALNLLEPKFGGSDIIVRQRHNFK